LAGLKISLGVVSGYLKLPFGTFRKVDFGVVHGKRQSFVASGIELVDGTQWGRAVGKANGELDPTFEPKGAKTLVSCMEEAMETGIEFPVYAHYGVDRAYINPPLRRRGYEEEASRIEALRGSLEGRNNFNAAFKWFDSRELEELRLQRDKGPDFRLPDLLAVRMAIESLFPDCKDVRIDVGPLRLTVLKEGYRWSLDELSDGYKTLLALVVDLAARYARANPKMPNPLEASGVVLIDEIDLHLHPAWQKRVVADLLRTFPNTQFILTTHSPFILEAVNNYLQRSLVPDERVSNDLKAHFSLSPNEMSAYVLSKGDSTSLKDEKTGLIYNDFLDELNNLTEVFTALLESDAD
jgi:predicted ATP-binding protein involved in virulence